MGVSFNADEVFEMAIRTEQNAAGFYRRAAELHADAGEVKLFLALANVEDKHRRTFEEMRSALTAAEKQESTFDPYDEAVLYLDAIADSSEGEGSPKIAESLTGNETLRGILEMAVQLEKDAILFYVGLLDLVPERLGRQKVQEIINQEKVHLTELAKELQKLEA
jgi:rubrerythrin